MPNNAILKLKQNIFMQAELYLRELGHFAPFGTVIKEEKIVPTGYYSDDELTDSREAISILKDRFSDNIKKGEATAAALAYDVTINVSDENGVPVKRDAMCVKSTSDGTLWEEEYFPYSIIDGKCIWK